MGFFVDARGDPAEKPRASRRRMELMGCPELGCKGLGLLMRLAILGCWAFRSFFVGGRISSLTGFDSCLYFRALFQKGLAVRLAFFEGSR